MKTMHDYNTVAQGLLRLTNWFGRFGLWDCGMASSMEASFEESYEVRALLHAESALKLGRAGEVAHAFCNLTLKLQGTHYRDMYDMGYGYEKNGEGMPACSCVADCCSVARAIIDTVRAYPDYHKNGEYIESVGRFIQHTLDNYLTETGVVGVGILGHKVNPMPEYWCANGLFSQVLISYGDLTGDALYYDAAVPILEFLASFDYENTEWREWETCPQMVILYAGEGIVEGLLSEAMKPRLNVPPKGVIANTKNAHARETELAQASNRVKSETEDAKRTGAFGATVYDALQSRWEEFAGWLYKNQSPNGLWYSLSGQNMRDYEPGLSWLISRAGSISNTGGLLMNSVKRQLAYLTSQDAKAYFGLFCRPFPTALAHLSFAYIAETIAAQDPEGFECAMDEEQADSQNFLW